MKLTLLVKAQVLHHNEIKIKVQQLVSVLEILSFKVW